MKKINKRSEKFEALRKKAEFKLADLNKEANQFEFKELSEYIEELNIHQIELEMQNEELIRAQEELEKSRSNYAQLYDFSPVGYFTFDKNGLILEVNLTGADMLGIERSYLIKKPFVQFVDHNYQDVFFLHCRKVLKYKLKQICEIDLLSKDKNKFHAKLESIEVNNVSNKSDLIRSVISDISLQKLSEEKIQNLLNEKDILLKEIHHRTKNSMITVFNLLSLKINRSNSSDTTQALQESCGLIKNMSILYDKLSKAGNYEKININEHLSSLIDEICQSYTTSEKIIAVEKEIENIDIKVKISFLLGIIINELLTNIYKYAFNSIDNCKIKISLKLKEKDSIIIIISDNGIGIPDDIILSKKYGLGLNLIDNLTQQLPGTFEIINKNGTIFKIEFKI